MREEGAAGAWGGREWATSPLYPSRANYRKRNRISTSFVFFIPVLNRGHRIIEPNEANSGSFLLASSTVFIRSLFGFEGVAPPSRTQMGGGEVGAMLKNLVLKIMSNSFEGSSLCRLRLLSTFPSICAILSSRRQSPRTRRSMLTGRMETWKREIGELATRQLSR